MKKQIDYIEIKISSKMAGSELILRTGGDDHKIAEAIIFLGKQLEAAREEAIIEEDLDDE